jgi:outer membrane protein TolC
VLVAAALFAARAPRAAAEPVSAQPQAADRSLTLGEALRLAGENAYGVKAAYHDSLSAEYGLRAAKSARFPSLAVGGNAFGIRPLDELGISPLQIEPDWSEIYATNLRLSYPIYTGGRRTNDIRRQSENLGGASSLLGAARLENAYRSRRAYIALLIADRMVGSADASLKRISVIRTNVQNLFDAGMADSIDVLETELSLRGAERLVEEKRNDRRNASTTLVRLLDIPDNETIVPTEFIPEPEPFRIEKPAADDIARRPELAAAAHRIASAGYQRSIVKANLLPVVSGMGGYALVKPDFAERGGDWQDLWFLGLTLSWDLNLGGKEFSESNQALESVRSLEMKRKDLEDTLLLQAQIAWNNVEEAYLVYGIQKDERNIATRRYALAEDKQKAGEMTVNRLLEIEAELTQSEQQFEAARLSYYAAVTDYLYAVGSDQIWEGL